MRSGSILARMLSRLNPLLVGATLLTIPAFGMTYKTITVPNSQSTAANGINNRFQVVGFFQDSSGAHGFELSEGKYSIINYPGVSNFTVATGINDQDVIVGYFFNTAEHGFIDRNGTFTQLDFPSSTSTMVQGINNRNQIVGSYTDATGRSHGFKFERGQWTTIDPPNSSSTSAQGINNAETIVGFYNDAAGQHGFTLTGQQNFQQIDFPNSPSTSATGINDKIQIVGQYLDPTIQKIEGFEISQGKFNQIEVPGASTTFPQGVNDRNFIVGSWFSSLGQQEGFVATPN